MNTEKELWFLRGADWAAKASRCVRDKVGAMIFDPETYDIIEPGYNGPPAGGPHCLDACPRARHRPHDVKQYGLFSNQVLVVQRCSWDGQVWPCPDAPKPGEGYETEEGRCEAIHAEANAIIRAGRRARGMWMATTRKPCDGCKKLIRGAGIVRVIWEEKGEKREWIPSEIASSDTKQSVIPF